MARKGLKAKPPEKPRAYPFSLATDPFAMETSHEVAGLYLAPPERVLALHIDSETLLRPKLRLTLQELEGEPAPAAVTTLLGSLDATKDAHIETLHRRRRGVGFRRFLSQLDKETPEGREVHLICDNYFTHKSPTVKNWLQAHPRFTMHFAPTEEAWLAHVERWFGYQAAREAFHGDKSSAAELTQGIADWQSRIALADAPATDDTDTDTDDDAVVGPHIWIKPAR